MKSFSFHTRLSGPGTSHENTSCNVVFRSLLHENYMKFSQNFQVGGAHTPGGSLRGFLPSLLDRRSASRRGCRGICSGRLMGMCLRCARCSTVSLKTLPEKAPRRFHFRSKFQVKTFQVEIFARTLLTPHSTPLSSPHVHARGVRDQCSGCLLYTSPSPRD